MNADPLRAPGTDREPARRSRFGFDHERGDGWHLIGVWLRVGGRVFQVTFDVARA